MLCFSISTNNLKKWYWGSPLALYSRRCHGDLLQEVLVDPSPIWRSQAIGCHADVASLVFDRSTCFATTVQIWNPITLSVSTPILQSQSPNQKPSAIISFLMSPKHKWTQDFDTYYYYSLKGSAGLNMLLAPWHCEPTIALFVCRGGLFSTEVGVCVNNLIDVYSFPCAKQSAFIL